MGKIIRADVMQLKAAAGSLKGYIGRIRSEAKALEADICQLSGSWEGSAYSAFCSGMTEDVKALLEACTLLDEVAAYEENAVRKYSLCSRKASGLAGR